MADGRKNNGAKKGENRGAGRKPKAEEIKLLAHIDAVVSSKQWQELLKVCYDKAKEGSTMHLKTLMEYRWGKPRESVDVTSNGNTIQAPIFNFKNGE